MRLSVVIPNWNGLRVLPALLDDLRRQTLTADEVIVVDNGSSDGSDNAAEAWGARVIRFPCNRGFAQAVNSGVAAAQADTVAILNNDLRLSEGWVAAIRSGLRDEHCFATGKVLSAAKPEMIDGTFDAVCRGGTAWRCGHGQPDGPAWNLPRTVSFAPFTAVLVRKDWYLELGGLDEAYGSYLEDVDFGLRSASARHTGAYVPGAVAWHEGSATLGRWSSHTTRLIARNQTVLLARHYGPKELRRFGWQIAVAHLLWGVVALRQGQGVAWLRGKLEGIRLFRGLRGPGLPGLTEVLESSEQLIVDLQRKAEPDAYWRWYFRLTR